MKYVGEEQQKQLTELQIALEAETIARLRREQELIAQKKILKNLRN